MIQLNVRVPVLVEHRPEDGRPQFHLRPLFQLFPSASHARYSEALNHLKRSIYTEFKNFRLQTSNKEELLWLAYSPELTFEQMHFSFRLGNITVDHPFMVVHFKQGGLPVWMLPTLNNLMISPTPGESLDQRLEQAIKSFLTEMAEEEGPEFDLSFLTAQKRDSIVHIELALEIQFEKLELKNEDDWFSFFSLFDQQDFDGLTELNKVGQNLNHLFPDELMRAHYREDVADRLARLLFTPPAIPLALVGPVGVGRHTLIHEALFRYLKKERLYEAPRQLWQVDTARIMSGMSYVGLWEKRLESILSYLVQEEVEDSEKDVEGESPAIPSTSNTPHVLLIDKPITLLRLGRSASSNLAMSEVFKPYLESRKLPLVLIAEPEEWSLMQQQNRAFCDLFQTIQLSPPDLYTAGLVLLEKRKQLEVLHGVKFSIAALSQLWMIYRNYMKHQALPGGITRPLEQLAVKYRNYRVDADEVRNAFQLASGLRALFFDTSISFEQNEAEQYLERQLVGQPEAILALTEVIHLFKARLQNPERPISSLLFIGPTGVGKTQAAKVLCRYLTGSEDQLLRFDMNEFVDPYAMDRLVGSPTQPEGQLTSKVRHHDFGVILLDEIEKAHPSIHDLLLQILDDGRLTDNQGRTVDFNNMIIIMTSNVGAEKVGSNLQMDTNGQSDAAVYNQALRHQFRPEFLNRIDKTVVFNALQPEHMLGIARLQINDLLKRDGFIRRTTLLNISEEVLQWIAHRGYDPKMGGRALRRQIEKDITQLSADQLLKIQSNAPIILNIRKQGDRLDPQIYILEFVEQTQTDLLKDYLSYEVTGGQFYSHLLNRTIALSQKLGTLVQDNPSEFTPEQKDWRYYDITTRVQDAIDHLKTMVIAHNDQHYRSPSSAPLRLKSCGLFTRKDALKGGLNRQEIMAKLFQESALKEISDQFQYSASPISRMETEMSNHHIDNLLLEQMVNGFLEDQYDYLRFDIQSLITGLGGPETAYLLDQYEMVLKNLDLPYLRPEGESFIRAEGFQLYELFKGENGIHLFYVAHQNPLPVRVQISRDQEAAADSYKVIRIYDSRRTLTDLRTAYTSDFHASVQEFKLFLLGGGIYS